MQKEKLLRAILSPEARSRLNNLKIVRPDFAEQLELQLIQLAQDRRLPLPLSDDQLKQILVELQNRKRDIRITRV
jgi:programmed cell death protein 5